MSHSKLAIAVLSDKIETYEQVTRLLGQSDADGFTIAWIDIRQAPPPDRLPSVYDAYLSDAPFAYLLEHHGFVQSHICFWLVATEVVQTELFNQGVADCFLLSEFNATLLKHCLRRQRAIAAPNAVTQEPLQEFPGDRFQTLVDHIPGAVYRCLYGDDWPGMYFSEAIADIVGYPATDFTAAGDRPYGSVIYPEDVAFVKERLDQHFAKQEPFALEYRVVHRDGSIRWVDERGQGVFDDSGNLLWIDGVIIDISEKKKLANDLQQQQRDYYEKTPAMLHSINEQGEIETVSDRWLAVMGYERSEVIGRKSTKFLTVKSRHYAESYALPLFFKNGYINDVEYQFIKKDGGILDVLLSAIIHDFSGEKWSLAVLVDITARNKLTAELSRYQNHLQAIANQRTQALASSETRFYTVFDLAPMGIVEVNLQGQFRLVNQQFMAMLGLTVEALLMGRVMDVTYGEDAETIGAILRQLQAGVMTTFSGDYRFCRGDDWFWGHLEMATVSNVHGEAEYFIATIEDIHDRKMMEESLRLSEARLAKAQAIAHVGHWEWELATNTFIWSDEKFRLFDLEPQSIEPTFEAFMAIVNPGDRPRIEAALETLKSGEKVCNLEYRITTAQNRSKIILEHVDIVFNEQGEITHFSGTIQDVTDFREAHLALQVSETRFRELVEHIDECFWINPEQITKIDYVSPAYEKIWGRSCESLIADGCSWLKSVHPDHRRQVNQAMARMNAGQDFNEEYRIVRSDGEERWVYARSAKILDKNGTVLRHVGVASDVTDRKQMELDLLASEARFRGIFDQAAVGIAQVSLGDQFLLVNQAFCDLVGYAEVELQQMTWQDITHPEDIGLRQPSIEQIISGEQKSTILETRYIHKQGHIVWVKAIASCVYGEDNQPEYLLTLVEDITAFKQAEAQLAHSQSRYRNLVEGVHGIIYQYSSTRGGIFYSFRVKDILGYDVEFLLEHSSLWYESIHPDDQPMVDQRLATLQSNQNFGVEYRIRDAWGKWRWFHDKTFSVEKVGDEFIINGLALDITQRKEADATLRHRLDLETVLAEISQLMIIQPELDLTEVLQPLGETFRGCGMSVMVRRAGTDLLESLATWTAPHAVDVSDAWQVIDINNYPWLAEKWLQQQYILINHVHEIPDAGAVERDVLISLDIHSLMLIPLSDHQGEAWGYISCTTTQQRPQTWSKEDADLLAIAGDLIYNDYERRQTRKQLEKAKEAAEAASRAKTQFLTNMSHELRTPLNSVLGFAQIMELSAAFPDEHREHLRILKHSGTNLLSLLNDILHLASFEGEAVPKIHKTLFDLSSLLDDLENMFRSGMTVRRGVAFQVVRAENLPRYITADQAKLHSVLTHLLSNALKFTSQGEVKLDVAAIAFDPLTIRFSVTDTGIGISEADQQKLFNNFVKLDGGEQLAQGSGLGLALSQKFAILMGSKIRVSSNPAGGSCFTFELPCDDRNPEIPRRSPHNLTPIQSLPLPTPEAFQALPRPWREDFHLAACAARSQRLEKLLAALPPEHQAIAPALQQCIDQLDFNQLADLSQP